MRPPPSLHEETITRLLQRDHRGAIVADAVLTKIEDDMLAAREALEALAAGVVAVLEDDSRPEAACLAEARVLTAQHAETAAKRLDAARLRAKTELADLADAMSPPTPDNAAEVKLTGEIRTALRAMPAEQRDAAIHAAIAGCDRLVLAAVFGGAAALTGMTDDDRAQRLAQWRSRAFPAEMERYGRIEQAAASIERAGIAVVAWVGRLNSNPRGAVAESQME